MRKFSRTPITYYGGKQKLVPTITEMIPEHKLYCEPFSGGAAVFFAKDPSAIEVLNDTNKELINFYKVLKSEPNALIEKVNATLYSRSTFNDAWTIYNNSHLFDPIDRACALWTLSMQGFSGQLSASWGYDRKNGSSVKRMFNRKDELIYAGERLKNVQIECTDATRIIESRDSDSSFFYVDPPYFNSDCGHYDGYTEDDFRILLETLSKIKGKFILSSYPSDILQEYIRKYGWPTIKKEMRLDAGKGSRKKIEVITANFQI
ncbi:MAG: DNA adenine methylase [Bacteroidales bacterium]